jgi:hypothetical protein
MFHSEALEMQADNRAHPTPSLSTASTSNRHSQFLIRIFSKGAAAPSAAVLHVPVASATPEIVASSREVGRFPALRSPSPSASPSGSNSGDVQHSADANSQQTKNAPSADLSSVPNNSASTQELFRHVGEMMKASDLAARSLHRCVVLLRERDVRLTTREQILEARSAIQTAFPGSKVIDKYVNNLRVLLSLRFLPESFTITNSVAVADYDIGEEVDVLWGTNVDATWWHAVVVEKRNKKQKLSFRIFWVGCPHSAGKLAPNPTWVSVHALRQHQDRTACGPAAKWDVTAIRKMFQLSFASSGCADDNDDDDDEDGAGDCDGDDDDNNGDDGAGDGDGDDDDDDDGAGDGDDDDDDGDDGAGDGDGDDNDDEDGAGDGDCDDDGDEDGAGDGDDDDDDDDDDGAGDGDDDEEDDEDGAGDGDDNEEDDEDGAGDGDDNDDDAEDGVGDGDDDEEDDEDGAGDGDDEDDDENGAGDGDDDEEDDEDGAGDGDDDEEDDEECADDGDDDDDDDDENEDLVHGRTPLNPGLVAIPNHVENAILSLKSLDNGKAEHPDLLKELKTSIAEVAKALAAFYKNKSYITLVNETLSELEDYAGPDMPQLPHSKEFLNCLLQYGFCVSPRMFTCAEILCIAIAMLDIRHHFIKIDQKTRKNRKAGYRGMAVLDPRVQRVLYLRLAKYGFVNTWYHPPALQSFSSVVINGGGSWIQAANWDFARQSRFALDTSVTPFVIRVSDTPGILEAGGLYVATTKKHAGHNVYAQVTRMELEKYGFGSILKAGANTVFEKEVLDTASGRLEVCSPRVMVYTGTGHDTWGIQLLPGYKSTMYIITFVWVNGGREAQCFKNTDVNGEACMQDCSICVNTVYDKSGECLKRQPKRQIVQHYLSFGTKKVALRDAECGKTDGIPGPLDPQMYHTDGPRLYDTSIYDSFGHLKTSALGSAARKTLDDLETKNAPASNKRRRGARGTKKKTSVPLNVWCPFIPNLLHRFFEDQNDILSESWSALGGVLKGTYIETIQRDNPSGSLRVPVPLGCMVMFTFYWQHRGKGDRKQKVRGQHSTKKKVLAAIHARPHFYAYSPDARKMPTFDTEATLEFTSMCSNHANHDDAASKIQVMETLQTFTPCSSLGHDEKDLEEVHRYFANQKDLARYIEEARDMQTAPKVVQPSVTSNNIHMWYLSLSYDDDSKLLVHINGRDNLQQDVRIPVTKADFESNSPLFHDKDGRRYQLEGDTVPTFDISKAANTPHMRHNHGLFETVIAQQAHAATAALKTSWCHATLYHLMCVLDTHVLQHATLHLDPKNGVLQATVAQNTPPIPLIPFYEAIDQMRLYTSRGIGTRFVIVNCVESACALPQPISLLFSRTYARRRICKAVKLHPNFAAWFV